MTIHGPRITAACAAFLLPLLLAFGCGTSGPPGGDGTGGQTSGSTGSIGGQVISAGSPVSGAQVSAVLESGVPSTSTTGVYVGLTDSAGEFALSNVAPGTYSLTAVSGTLVGLRPGVVVAAGTATAEQDVTLSPTGSLTGRVTRGAETGNAGCLAWVAGASLVGVTADDGTYTINLVPVGDAYTVMGTAPGYSVAQETGIAVTAGATTTVPDMALTLTDNHIPQIATLTCDPLRLQSGGTCTLTVEATDDDGDTITYTWSAAEGTLSATTGDSVDWTAPGTDGSYVVTVVADDGRGGAASAAFAVLVATDAPPNSAPTISAMTPADGTDVAKGTSVAASVTASDADGNPLTYTWSATGGGFTGSGNAVTWIAPQTAGTYTITCVVTDGQGGMDQETRTVTVSDMNVVVW